MKSKSPRRQHAGQATRTVCARSIASLRNAGAAPSVGGNDLKSSRDAVDDLGLRAYGARFGLAARCRGGGKLRILVPLFGRPSPTRVERRNYTKYGDRTLFGPNKIVPRAGTAKIAIKRSQEQIELWNFFLGRPAAARSIQMSLGVTDPASPQKKRDVLPSLSRSVIAGSNFSSQYDSLCRVRNALWRSIAAMYPVAQLVDSREDGRIKSTG